MSDILQFLKDEAISPDILEDLRNFRRSYPSDDPSLSHRLARPDVFYLGKDVWEKALCALLAGKNLLLCGPKATGKNVLAESLCAAFARPVWNISFHINMDAYALIGSDTYDGNRVVFRSGPVKCCAESGGFAVLDEMNMAKNEALAVMHSALDHRRIIDIPGYDVIPVSPAARFIGTMNYGYAGTRELNEALSSRFVILSMPAIGEENLNRLLCERFPQVKKTILAQFAKLFLELSEKAKNAEISDRATDLRGLLDAVSLIMLGTCAADALEMCIVNKTFDEYERGLIRDVILSRIPGDLTRQDL